MLIIGLFVVSRASAFLATMKAIQKIGARYFLKLGNLMRFVSRSVVTGFVNALAILIFMAQLPKLINATWHVHAMTLAGSALFTCFRVCRASAG